MLLFICSLVLQLYAAPLQDVADEGVSVQKTTVQDTVQLLTDEWVLRDHLVEKGGTHIPVMPLDSLTLVLFDDQNYKLNRPKHASVEWGK